MQNKERSAALLNRALQIIVLIYQAMAVVIFLAGIFLGNRWLRAPFLGAFYEHTMVFNGVGPANPSESWKLFEQVELGDQLAAVNNQAVRSTAEVQQALSGFFPGETIPVTIRDGKQGQRILNVTLYPFPASDQTVFFIIPVALSGLFLTLSIWIFGLRRTEPAGRAFSIFTSSLAIVTGGIFDLYTTHYMTYAWTLGAALTGGSLITLALAFPQEPRIIMGRPHLRWVGLVIAILLAFYAFTTLFNFENPTAYIGAWQFIYALVGISGLIYILANLYHGLYAQSPVVKTQARTILAGTLLAFGPMVVWLLLSLVKPLNFSPYLFVPVILFPLTTGYTIMRFRFLRLDDFLRRGIAYLMLTVVVVLGYAVLVTGTGMIFATVSPSSNPYFVGTLIFLIAIALEPIRSRLQGFVDTIFFRGQKVFTERLQDFSHQLTTTLDLSSIGAVLREQIASTLTPDRVHVYTYDSLNDQYIALAGEDRRPPAISDSLQTARWRVISAPKDYRCISTAPPRFQPPCSPNNPA